MAKPGEVLYTEGHRYPRSRRIGGKEKEKSEGNYRIVKRGNRYMPQRKGLFGWKDMQYMPCDYEYAKAIILKEKGEEEVVEYM